MKTRIALVILISLSVWCNQYLSELSQEHAYLAGYESATVDYSRVKITPAGEVEMNKILLLANTVFTQLLLLILFVLLLIKSPNRSKLPDEQKAR